MKSLNLISTAATVSVLATVLSVPVSAQDVSRDLQSVLALQGHPCGQVTGSQKQGSDHYIAQCSNGMRYRIQADASGRVVVTPL